jgi:hypothetical protein
MKEENVQLEPRWQWKRDDSSDSRSWEPAETQVTGGFPQTTGLTPQA